MDWDSKIYIHNLLTKFPWEDNSIDVIYSSHTLEHFSKTDGQNFLSECHRVLKKEGIIRIVVPDLDYFVREYINGEVSAEDFLTSLSVLYITHENPIKNVIGLMIQFPHKCMYNSSSLLKIIQTGGFDASTKMPFDSAIDDICQIEMKGRATNAVIIEGRKR